MSCIKVVSIFHKSSETEFVAAVYAPKHRTADERPIKTKIKSRVRADVDIATIVPNALPNVSVFSASFCVKGESVQSGSPWQTSTTQTLIRPGRVRKAKCTI